MIDELAAKTARYVNQWTTKELFRLAQTSTKPICLPRPDAGYFIGKYEVWPQSGQWICQNYFTHETLNFNQKQSAVFYSLCNSAGYVKLADAIANSDAEITKLQNDLEFYNHSLRISTSKADEFRMILYKSRITDTRFKLNIVFKQLQKTIRHAKYLKVWSDD